MSKSKLPRPGDFIRILTTVPAWAKDIAEIGSFLLSPQIVEIIGIKGHNFIIRLKNGDECCIPVWIRHHIFRHHIYENLGSGKAARILFGNCSGPRTGSGESEA